MTAMIVFAALIAVNVAYSIYDSRNAETARQIDDYYRVEFKKTYQLANEQNTVSMYWYRGICIDWIVESAYQAGVNSPAFCYVQEIVQKILL